jgi:hypothetical protein
VYEGVMVKYFFKSKVSEKWISCPDEITIKRMVADGYEVKKVVIENRKEESPVTPLLKFYRMDA